MSNQDRMEQLFNEAFSLGVKEIEIIVRKIFDESEDLDIFNTGMGQWDFYSNKYKKYFYEGKYDTGYYTSDDDDSFVEVVFDFSELESFMERWNCYYNFTASYIEIRKDSKTISNVEVKTT